VKVGAILDYPDAVGHTLQTISLLVFALEHLPPENQHFTFVFKDVVVFDSFAGGKGCLGGAAYGVISRAEGNI
jgi:hypothetical protein